MSTYDFLNNSYLEPKKQKDIGNYKLDKSLSGQRVQVYHDPVDNKTTIVNRGTKKTSLQDVGSDIKLAFSGYNSIKNNKRITHAKKVQEQAKAKYGTVDRTLGHSYGGLISQATAESGTVETYNSAHPVHELKPREGVDVNHTRAKGDLVSILAPATAKTHNNDAYFDPLFRPLKTHSIQNLKGKTV
jgi:hypothetical protein